MKKILFAILSLMALASLSAAQASVSLRFLCFQDGNECDVYADLLARFSEMNPDISVSVDVVAEAEIHDRLSAEVAAGAAPDMARISDLDALSGHYLDLRPLLRDAAAFEASYPAPYFAALRGWEAGEGLHGYPDALDMVAPFVNVSLFEGAGVALPGAERELGRLAGGAGPGRRGD